MLKFKSIPIREPDIVNHLKNNLVYEFNGKKNLYRFYDPRVWLNLNYFHSSDFLWLNKYFKEIELGFLGKSFKFSNNTREHYLTNIDFNLLSKIGINNRVVDILKLYTNDLAHYFLKVNEIFRCIDLTRKVGIYSKYDLVSAVFHTHLIGESFLETELFQKLNNSSYGYEQASKQLSTNEWEVFFNNHKIFDENLKNKVMYEY